MTECDETSLAEFLANQNLVRSVARDLLVDPDATEDVVQQTWLAALRHASRGSAVEPSLLKRIAQRLAFNRLRNARRQRLRDAHASPPEPLPAPSDILAAEDLRRRVVEAVLGLAEPLRSTVVLRYLREHSEAEVAERMVVPLETVRSRLKKARSILRERLSGDDPQPTARGLVALAGMTPKSVGALVTKGAVTMGAKAWIGAAAAVVLVAAFAWHELAPKASSTDARDAAARTHPESAIPPMEADAAIVVRAARSPVATDEAAPGAARVPRVEFRGRCVTPEGAPIEGATIMTKDIPTWPTATSDATGRFAIEFDAPILAPQNEAIDCSVVASASGRASVAKPIRLERAAVSELGTFVLPLGGEVRGVVLGEDDRPIRAKVWVHSGRLTNEEIAVGLADDEPHVSAEVDGRFAFAGLAEGWYSVFATDPDAVCEQGVPVGVVAGTTSDVRVRMRPMRENERIRGRVLDATGQPVDPAELRWVRLVMSPSGVRMATHFVWVHHGEFSCWGGPAENSFTATFADGRSASVSGVRAGDSEVILQEPPPVDPVADPGAAVQNASLAGTVDGVDDPHGEIRVVMRGIDSAHEFDEWRELPAQRWTVVASSTVDERGAFALTVKQPKPSPSRCVLRAECLGYAPTQIDVAQERLASLDPFHLTLTRGGTIAGAVGAPGLASAAGLAVLASNADGDCTSTHVAEDGTYRLENLRPGGWHVAVREDDQSRRLPATRASYPPPNAIVTNGETTTLDLNFETPPPVVVTGVIRIGEASTYDLNVSLVEAASGAGGRVGALNRLDRSARLGGINGRVLPSGAFRIDVAKPGDYVLNVSRGLELVSMTVSRPVTLALGANTVDVIVACGSVSGTCTLTPLPARKGSIAVSGELADHTTVQLNTACSPDGSFQIPLVPAGTLTIAADTARQTIEVREGATTTVELPKQ